MKTHKTLTSIVLLCSAGALMAAPATGWQQNNSCQNPSAAQANASKCDLSDTIGARVIGQNNQNLGTIRNFVINLNDGRLSFAVVDTGTRDVAVPMSMLTRQGNQFDSQINRQQLRAAPDFAKMDLQNPGWSGDVYAAYNMPMTAANGEVAAGQIINEPAGAEVPEPMVSGQDQDQQWNQVLQMFMRGKQSAALTDQWLQQQESANGLYPDYPVTATEPTAAGFNEAAGTQAPAPQSLVRSTDLTGMTVRDQQGQPVGVIKDVVVDWANGRVIYAALDPEGTAGLGNHYYAIPPQALARSSAGATLTLNMSLNQLAAAPSFNPANWPAGSNQAFVTQVYQYYNTPMYWNQSR